jgi:hypothetical protein
VNLDRFKTFLTRNWREKLVAILLAFLFWFMIKSQTGAGARPLPPLPPLRAE